MAKTSFIGLALALVLTAAAPGGNVLDVPAAYDTIQIAIDAAKGGDEVRVAPGTYAENIDLRGKAILVRGAGGRAVTTIDGQGLGSVVSVYTDEGPDTIIEGFTLTGGLANSGGGMRIFRASPTVRECAIVANAATFIGGGLYLFESTAAIVGCSLLDNTAQVAGGGMHNESSSPTITDCDFERNRTIKTDDGGGGAMNSVFGQPIVERCRFVGNSGAHGGAMANGEAPAVIRDCTFARNVATVSGGAMENQGPPPSVSGSVFCDNEPDDIRGDWVDDGGNEFLGDCAAVCPADLDGSGDVSFDDLVLVLAAWGDEKAPEDIDGSGLVDFGDLLMVLDAWGPCP